MPASEVMSLYRQHKLHSGPGGPVVKKKKQAVAIQISMARKEGHDIPKPKGSFQQGGMVPETGDYKVHQGEQVAPPRYGRQAVRLEDTGLQAQQPLPEITIRSAPSMHRNFPEHEPVFRHGGAPVPPQRRELVPSEPEPSAQAQDIATRTRGAQEQAYQTAMHARPGQDRTVPGKNDPVYAIRGLQGHVAQRMHEQGVRGSFDEGGTVQQTGNYEAHAGEELVPPVRASAPGPTTSIQDVAKRKPGGGDRPNPQLEQAQAAVAAPLQRVPGFRGGGTIPRTGIYRLHAGEHVIPASLAKRYREMKR
jgi:Family of unknown function (DUF6496)